MPKKRFSAEQIIIVLRQIEVLTSQGKTPAVACREAGVSQQSYYRWRKEYGGFSSDRSATNRFRRTFSRSRSFIRLA
jgi:putative transposase